MNPRVLSRALICMAALVRPAAAEVPEEWLETPVALAFGAPPTIAEPMLSPDGTHLVFLSQDALGVTMLRTLNLADGSVGTLLQGSEDGYDILWCDFANTTRLICDLRQGIPGRSTNYQRFYTMDLDGSGLQEMQRGTGCQTWQHLRDTPPIDRIPDDPEQLMFVCGRSASRVNVDSRRTSDVGGAGEVGSRQTLYSNGHGLPNIYSGVTQDTVRWHVRAAIDEPWQEFLRQDRLTFEAPFRPVGYGTSLDQVFNIGWDDESGTWSLFRQELTGNYENELVFSHGVVDLELVDTMGPDNRVVSVAYLEDRSRRAIVDRRVADVYQFLAELLPNLDIEILDESWDQNIYLARARALDRSGDFLLVNMETEAVQVIAPEYEHLTGYQLAPTQLVEIDGSDGGSFAAYLTLPHDVTGPVPAVIMPRARASHEDVADPNYLVQFLAASGYAVLRIQNRVGPDYRSGWLPLTAVVGWQQTAQDIRAAADFLTANEISNADTLCGIGKDYGAHSALITAIEYPDLFSCVVSIAALADPRLTPGAEIIRTNVGGVGDDVLNDASPIQRSAEMEAAVLMFHGEADADFNMADHTVTLSNTLDRAGKQVRFIEYPYANHQIRRAPYRIDMLVRIGEFLDTHIGPSPAAPPPPDAPTGAEGAADPAGGPGVESAD